MFEVRYIINEGRCTRDDLRSTIFEVRYKRYDLKGTI